MYPINFFTTLALLFLYRGSINIFLLYVTLISAPKVPNKDKNEIFECDFQHFPIHEMHLMYNII
jgi:NADH:ubiquinone oxidoreductase subunit 3 (subunit A)